MYSACVLCSKLSCHISDVGTWICSSTLLKCSSSRYAIWRTSWSVLHCSIIGWELLSCVIRNSFGTMSDLTEPLMNAQKTQLEPEAEHDLEAHVFSRMVSLMVVGRRPSENPFHNFITVQTTQPQPVPLTIVWNLGLLQMTGWTTSGWPTRGTSGRGTSGSGRWWSWGSGAYAGAWQNFCQILSHQGI